MAFRVDKMLEQLVGVALSRIGRYAELAAAKRCSDCHRNALIKHRLWRLWSGQCLCGRYVVWFTPSTMLGDRK